MALYKYSVCTVTVLLLFTHNIITINICLENLNFECTCRIIFLTIKIQHYDCQII